MEVQLRDLRGSSSSSLCSTDPILLILHARIYIMAGLTHESNTCTNVQEVVKWSHEPGTMLKNGYCATLKDNDKIFLAIDIGVPSYRGPHS